MKIQTSTSMIASQTACSARMVPSRSQSMPKLNTTIRADQKPQHPLEALYKRTCARTAALLLSGLALSSSISPAALAADTDPAATSSNNPLRAVAEFYRNRQQANGGSLFLGPIQLSRQRLENAATALQGGSSDSVTEKYSEALKAVRGASLDCIVFNFEGKQDLTTASSSEQEYKFGDPCKLRLVVKNATTLTRDKNLVADTEAKMQLIIRQLQLLDDLLDRATQGDADVGEEKIAGLLKEAVSTNVEFEDDIKRCLGLEA